MKRSLRSGDRVAIESEADAVAAKVDNGGLLHPEEQFLYDASQRSEPDPGSVGDGVHQRRVERRSVAAVRFIDHHQDVLGPVQDAERFSLRGRIIRGSIGVPVLLDHRHHDTRTRLAKQLLQLGGAGRLLDRLAGQDRWCAPVRDRRATESLFSGIAVG